MPHLDSVANHHKSFSLHAMTLPWAVDWSAEFGREARLLVEIGFGNGVFLAGLAHSQPNANIVGIERAHAPLTWTESRIRREKLGNVRLVNGQALMALTCLFEPASIHTVHINFSDPWFKNRHQKRRLINDEFMRVLHNRLQPGGVLYIATDILSYATEINTALHKIPGLRNTYDPDEWRNQRDDPSVTTPYEQKALQAGRACCYFKWQCSAPPDEHPPVEEEHKPMPNVRMQLSLSPEKIAGAFEPMTVRHRDRIVNFLHVYQQTGAPILLFEVLAQEPLFDQRLMLMLRRRNDGEFLIQFAPVGYPRATRGVHDAVYHLMQWLLKIDPDAAIIDQHVKAP